MRPWAGWAIAALAAGASAAEARPLRILSLDQCADQYVLALAAGADLALSPRADDPDAYLRAEARGRRQVRPTLEAAIAFQPDVVVRYWGGDTRLLSRLHADGVRVASIEDSTDFEGIRANIRSLSQALKVESRGEALIAAMDARLARAATPQGVRSRGRVQYLTPGGFTAGPGTLVDAVLAAAGFANAATTPGFAAVNVERIALYPPARFVLGFFDQSRSDWRGPGRHPVVRKAAEGRVTARLKAATLTCPAWFVADAAADLAAAR